MQNSGFVSICKEGCWIRGRGTQGMPRAAFLCLGVQVFCKLTSYVGSSDLTDTLNPKVKSGEKRLSCLRKPGTLIQTFKVDRVKEAPLNKAPLASLGLVKISAFGLRLWGVMLHRYIGIVLVHSSTLLFW